MDRDQRDQILRKIGKKCLWANFWIVYFVFGKLFYPLWHFYASGQIVIAVNGHTLNNNTSVWSHWQRRNGRDLGSPLNRSQARVMK